MQGFFTEVYDFIMLYYIYVYAYIYIYIYTYIIVYSFLVLAHREHGVSAIICFGG